MAAAKLVTYTGFLKEHDFFAIFDDDDAIDENSGHIRVDDSLSSCQIINGLI